MISSSNLTNSIKRLFRKLSLLTILSVYLIVVAGGIVRSTGSGMGCPDWPKCFGQYIPPTHISQLPDNYQQIYGAKLKGEVEFNAFKTWTEYINRLIGAFSGLLVFATLLLSLYYINGNRPVFLGSFVSFLLIGFNGWLGSRVVATELAPYMVTIHMLLAIGVIFSLIFVYVRSKPDNHQHALQPREKHSLNVALMVTGFLSLTQVVMGTQVREAMDEVMKLMGESGRAYWIDRLGLPFYVHRSFSILVLASHVLLLYRLKRISGNRRSTIVIWSNWLLLLVILEVLSGVVMAYLAVPAAAQPVHLVLAFLMLGIQFMLVLLVNADTLLGSEHKGHLSKNVLTPVDAIHR